MMTCNSQRSNNTKKQPIIMTCRPSCCLVLVVLCALLLLFCTTAALGFAPEITSNKRSLHQLTRVSLSSSSSLRKQVENQPQYHSSAYLHHHHHHAGFPLAHGQKSSALSMLRGGGGIGVFVNSMMQAPLAVQTTTAYVSVLFLAVSNVALLVAPNFVLETLYNIKPSSDNAAADDDDVASTTFLRLIATAGLGVAITLYLAIIQQKESSSSPPLTTAMGWGLVPRLIFFWYLLLFENRNRTTTNNNTLKPSFGSLQENKRFFIINTILTTWVATSLLLGLGNPAMTARTFSTMSIIKGSLLIMRPLSVGSKFVGFDVGRKGLSKTRALLRVLGNEFLVAAVLMASLAFGLNAVKAAGLVFAVWTVLLLLLDVTFVSKPWAILEEEGGGGPRLPRMAQIINIVIPFIFAAGFLLPFILVS